MEIKQINLEGDKPVRVLAELDFDELVYLATVTGKFSPAQAEEILPGAGAHANGEIYLCLTGELFNRFYDGGEAEARRHITS
jgi:hypothetical protein